MSAGSSDGQSLDHDDGPLPDRRPLLERQPVPLHQRHRRLEVDLRAVLGSERGERIGRVPPSRLGEAAEQCLEAARHDDLEHTEFVVASIPERVPATARLGEEVPRRRRDLDALLDEADGPPARMCTRLPGCAGASGRPTSWGSRCAR